MRNVWIGGVAALALAWTAGVAAQTTASPGTSDSQAGQGTVTVVGCLKPAEAMGGATGTSGSTATATTSTAGGDRFMLTNARMGGSASSAQTGTSGTTTAGTTTAGTTTAGTTTGTTSTASRPGTASGSMASYTLDGNASELRPHLNHQVEITGRLASAGAAGGSARYRVAQHVHCDRHGDACRRRPDECGAESSRRIGEDDRGDLPGSVTLARSAGAASPPHQQLSLPPDPPDAQTLSPASTPSRRSTRDRGPSRR